MAQSSDRDKDKRVQQTLFCLNRHQEVMAFFMSHWKYLQLPLQRGGTTALCKMYFLLTKEELFASPTDYYSFPLSTVTSQLVASLTTLSLGLEGIRHGKYKAPL